ncbi:hypothetical protein J4218_05880 [Candidatus Pacearchaeota archaeon]|nr:hypothetical protein [Candidatus Pacearchaeota archaeon]
MIKLLTGLILIVIPFLLVNLFEDKKKGFFYILSCLIGFHLIISLLTQFFHFFSYNILLLVYVLLDIVIIIYYYQKDAKFFKLKFSFKNIKIDWMLVLVLIILIIGLGSVHFNYTGKISTINGIRDVNNVRIIYPYYSDEWSAISLVNYVFENNSLPLKNSLIGEGSFMNFELGFHSFIAGIMLFLGLTPITDYVFLSLFFGILICILVYFILRINGIGKLNSGIACLLIPFIVNGSNLPGIWYLLPVTIGLVCMLLGYLFISMNEKKASVFISLLVLLFYPPLFVFYTLSLIFFILFTNFTKREKLVYFSIYFGICLLVAFILSIKVLFEKDFSFFNTASYIFSKLIYSTYTENAIPDYSIWKVIPILILTVSIVGIFSRFFDRKKYWLLMPIFIGLIFWVVYSFSLFRFIIEYQRVVFVVSILIVCFSGFGLDFLESKFKNKYFKEYNMFFILQLLILVVIFLFSFFYTSFNNWEDLKLNYLSTNQLISPNAPANTYLIEDDLILFKEINKKRFLSLPWKGLVIGSATGNYPLDSKDSTLTVSIVDYAYFINSNCSIKKELALNHKIDFVYSIPFFCEDYFEFVGKSPENMHLYRFIDR